jgi:hypothetical protein
MSGPAKPSVGAVKNRKRPADSDDARTTGPAKRSKNSKGYYLVDMSDYH